MKHTEPIHPHKWISTDLVDSILHDLTKEINSLTKKHIEPLDTLRTFYLHKQEQKPPFNSGDILTDGDVLIYIGSVTEPNWTYKNNYGQKDYTYNSCKYLIINDKSDVWPIMDSNEDIPALWFRYGYHLSDFKVIMPKMINEKLLKQLMSYQKK